MHRFLRFLLLALLPMLLLLPQVGGSPKGKEAPWREAGWTGAFVVPRPSLPDTVATLDAAGPITTDIRIRIHQVLEPAPMLEKLLKEEGREANGGLFENPLGPKDPFSLLREAILWGGRRTFTTVHRAASQELRDLAKQTDRLHNGRTPIEEALDGVAQPLSKHPGLKFIQEVIPQVSEELTGTQAKPEEEEEGYGEQGHLSHIQLPGQPAGLYILEVLKGDSSAHIPWLVTDLALLAEQDGSNLRLQAVQAQNGAPRGDIQGKLFQAKNLKDLSFSSEGKAQISASPGLRRTVLIQSGASFAALSIEGMASAKVRQRIFAFTERPLYRPGQEVFAKAILRVVKGEENTVPKGISSLKYRVLDMEDTEISQGQAKLLAAETATFACSFQLPGSGRLGLYRVIFEGPEGPGQAEFKVEQFIKPAFAVAVKATKSKVGLGEPLRFEVSANYFYGAPVSSAKGEWFLYKLAQRQSWSWDEGESSVEVPELVESGTMELGPNGQGLPPEVPAKEEGAYRMVVKIENAAGQRNSGSAQIRAASGDIVLFVRTDREVAQPGQPFTAFCRAVDLEGQDVKGIATTLKLTRIEVQKDSSYWWARPSALKPGALVDQAKGPKAQLKGPEGGIFLVVAEAQDRSGRTIKAQKSITLAGEGTPLPAVRDLRIVPDKRDYQVGETARLLVQLPKPNLTLHWALEHEELGQNQHRAVPGTSTIVEIPITKEMQPNVWAVFQIVASGTRQLQEVPIRVPRTDKKLHVDVRPDQERYRPGGKMKLAFEVKDWQGKPSSADLAVGVVDEAIYALSPELHPDPLRFFWPHRRHGVQRAGSTDWSFFDWLRKQRPVWSLKKTKKGEFKADDDKVRKNFKDTAAWAPYIAIGPDGKGSFELELPDNLTAWRATATAVTPATQIGVGRASRPASKPLQVSLTLPRTLCLGEEARAIALVRNLSGQPLKGNVKLEVKNGQLEGPVSGSFQLNHEGEHRFACILKPSATGSLTLIARVEGGGLKDAEQQGVTVVEPLVSASQSGYLVLNGNTQETTVPVPPKAQGAAQLVLTPVATLEQLTAPSLPYLIQYPYGCVEQTLSSFIPNVLVADLVKNGAAPPLKLDKVIDLDRNIREGVFKVYGYQLPNGAWGWWSARDEDADALAHTTGYALQSLALMKKIGYPVDEGTLRRGRDAAKGIYTQATRRLERIASGQGEQQDRAYPDSAGDAAYVLLCLVQAGEPVSGLLDSAADKVLSNAWKGNHTLALLTLAAAESKHPKAKALLAKLVQNAQTQGGVARWSGAKDAWWCYASGEIVPTATALKALCLMEPKSPLIPQAEAFLASQFQGQGWYSTWSTAQVLSTLPYLAKSRKLQWEGACNLQAKVDNGPSWDFKVKQRSNAWYWRPSKEAQPGVHSMTSPQPVKFSASGQGVLIWTYAYQVPGSAAPATAQSSGLDLKMSLNRNLWRLKSPVQTGNYAKGWIKSPWTGQLSQGEEAWMEVEMQVSRAADYAILEVPIPAGLEPTVKLEGFILEGRAFTKDDSVEHWYYKPRIEVHSDKVSFLFSKLFPWSHARVQILLRAGMAGQYKLRPAKLSLMSNETRWVTTEPANLSVLEKK